MTDEVIGWVVVALAAYRLARIVAADSISDAARERVYRFAWIDPADADYPRAAPYERTQPIGELLPIPRAPWRTYVYGLVSCPLCLGVWFAAGLYAVWRWWTWMPAQAFVIVLAIAGVQCFLATREGA